MHEVLPSLNKGVIVYVHDLFLLTEYPKEWVLEDYKYWNDQYLFQAFLSFLPETKETEKGNLQWLQ